MKNNEIIYFAKGVIKIIGYIVGFIIYMIPLLLLTVYSIIAMCGGSDKALDEYLLANVWLNFWNKAGNFWSKW